MRRRYIAGNRKLRDVVVDPGVQSDEAMRINRDGLRAAEDQGEVGDPADDEWDYDNDVYGHCWFDASQCGGKGGSMKRTRRPRRL